MGHVRMVPIPFKDKAESWEEYRALVDELWGGLTTVSQIRKVGKGKDMKIFHCRRF